MISARPSANGRRNTCSPACYLRSAAARRCAYQKWGNAGVKIVCYSQQRSKPYLVKDPDCDAPHYWADEIEQKVVEIMMARRVERSADGHPAPIGAQNALDGLRARLEAEKNKLKRLYALYASGDDALLELIDEQRDIVAGIEKALPLKKKKLRPRGSLDILRKHLDNP